MKYNLKLSTQSTQDSLIQASLPDSAFILQDSSYQKPDTVFFPADSSKVFFQTYFGSSMDSDKDQPGGKFLYRKSMFRSHELVPKNHVIIERNTAGRDWITFHLVVCLLLFAGVQMYYSKRLQQIIKAFGGMRYTNILSKEGNLFRERISIPLFIIYLVSFSLLIYLIIAGDSEPTVMNLSGLKFFSIIVLGVLLTWFIKNLALNFIGVLFKNQLILSDYMHINFIFNMVTGIILLPFVIFSVYSSVSYLVYAAVVVWLLIYFYRFVRELFTGLSYTNFSLFSRILYLCTFEIIPFLVVTKLIMSYLN
jgi:hypothetical protein